MFKTTIAALLLVSNVSAQDSPHVMELDASNFEQAKKDHPKLAINFYASWCPYSRMFMPVWHDAANQAQSEGIKDVQFAQLMCDKNKAVCEENDIEHFPDTHLYMDGEFKEFSVDRRADIIVNYLKKHIQPLVSKDRTCSELEDVINKEHDINHMHFFFFGPTTDGHYVNAFEPFAKMEIDEGLTWFYQTTDTSCQEKLNAHKDSKIVMFRGGKNFEETQRLINYKGSDKLTELSTFSKTHFVPPIIELDLEHDDLVLAQDSPVVIFFRDDKDADAPYMKEFEKAALANEGKIVFAYASGKKNMYQAQVRQFMEIEDHELPMLSALRPSERIRYHSPVEPEYLRQDFINRWVQSVIDRKEKPWVKSQAKINDGGPITHIVGTEHDEVAKDPTKDVFVDYFAPWCGHCQRFEPTLKQLAYYFQYDDDLLISNFDCTQNEVVGDWIKYYPTFVFYPMGKDSEPIHYEGDRTFEAMKDWLFKNSKALKNRKEVIKEDL